ncbi:MAG: TolC family protein [Myxococcales bacterium]|nr:TolC family protein [Myxococcales bacterium]
MSTLLLFVILAAPPAEPAFAGAETLTLDAVVDFSRRHNPRLLALRQHLARARATAEATAPWPEPMLTLSASPLPVVTRNGPAWGSAMLSQPLPWLQSLDAAREAATADATQRAAQLDEAELEVAFAVRRAYHALHLARAEAAVIDEVRTLARRTIELAQARLAVDLARQTDVLRAQVELARLDNLALDLAAQQRTRRAELNTLLGRGPEAPLPPTEPPADKDAPETIDALLERGRARHPALAARDAAIEAARARLRAAQTLDRPKFTVGVGYTLIGEADNPAMTPESGRDAVMLQVGAPLPVFGQAPHAAAERAAELDIEAAQADRRDEETRRVYQILEAHIAVETAHRGVRLYTETVLPLAHQTVDVLEAAYAVGQVGFLDVLDAERALERYGLEAAQARAELGVRLAALAWAVGDREGGDDAP